MGEARATNVRATETRANRFLNRAQACLAPELPVFES